MADETLRRNLDGAFDPGPGFPHPLLLSRTMAILDAEAKAAGPGQERRMRRPRFSTTLPTWSLQLVAAVLMTVLAVAAVAAFLAIHQRSAPSPARSPFQVKGPGAFVCNGGPGGPRSVGAAPPCSLGLPLFASPNVGWLTESTGPCDPTTCNRRFVLFRTDDGGHRWRLEFNWGGVGADVIRANADGMEALAMGSDSQRRAVLFHTTDGGAHWTSERLPPGTGQATQTGCKVGICTQSTLEPQVYFLDPREGWVFSQEATSSVADLFHTMDSGAHWSLSARIDIKAQFNLDLATGSITPSGFDHSMPGQFLFHNSSTGWFVPNDSISPLFRTLDGGATWRVQTIQLPTGAKLDQTPLFGSGPQFFNSDEGVLQVGTYVYTTADGGDHWGDPVKLPQALVNIGVDVAQIHFIDAKNWVGWPLGGGWVRTSDAGQHWDRIPAASQQGFTPVPNSGLPLRGDFFWFDFLTPSQGWAYISGWAPGGIAPAGWALYETTDGGVNWTPLSLPELRG